jgi:Integrase core domain
MMAKPTAFLLADLGVTKSHSRPHTSNDNPFSEAHFKTLKYQPQFPKRFGCIEDARAFCRRFFIWYNQDHHHAGIGLMTPEQVHYGQANVVHAARQDVLTQAYQANPERFVSSAPKPPAKPTATWINPPSPNLGCSWTPPAQLLRSAPPKSDRYPPMLPGLPLPNRTETGCIASHLLTGIIIKLSLSDAAPVELWSTPFLALSINPQVDFSLAF